MRKNRLLIAVIIAFIAAVLIWLLHPNKSKDKTESLREIKPVIANIKNSFSTTGYVLPRNRLEIKPPVSGRIEEILVKEGQQVKNGTVLVWMSSTERAALLDAAAGQSQEKLNYWKQVYKAIPLIAPIDAQVIVATTQPGQAVSTSDAVVVLSDRLIVRAQVDETDIGKVKLGQEAEIELDAYPDAKIPSSVEHIYYESQTVNNVTVYLVDLILDTVPEFFRSGMNASVNFIVAKKDGALVIPAEALQQQKGANFVLVKDNASIDLVQRQVQTGIADDKNIEIVSGLSENDTLIIRSKKMSFSKNNTSTNPFMPQRPRSSGQQSQQSSKK